MTIQETRSRVMKAAHLYIRKGLFPTWGECVKAAWLREQLIASMKKSLEYFVFKKKNGQTRLAIGTLRPVHLKGLKGRGSNSPDVVRFFDMMSGGWRSFRIELLHNWSRMAA